MVNFKDNNADKYEEAYWFIFNGSKILIKRDGYDFPFLSTKEIKDFGFQINNQVYLGEKDGIPLLGMSVDQSKRSKEYRFTDFRKLYGIMKSDDIWLVGNGYQQVQFELNNIYCGKCGQLNDSKKGEKAKICPSCGLMVYSRISPAVIMAVTKGDELLLARSAQFHKKLYSVLAGFVEPGETLEQCVQREVMEEVGIKIKNIKYFGSQPWPFTSSLMMAYTAEYESGDISVDDVEIVEARWFKADNMPLIPSSISIARQLIDWFMGQNK